MVPVPMRKEDELYHLDLNSVAFSAQLICFSIEHFVNTIK